MERRAALTLICRLLLCATVCTAYGASATSLLPQLLPHLAGSSAASAASAASASQARPLIIKGRTIMKYAVRYSASSYSIVSRILLWNLKGGDYPNAGFATSCSVGAPAPTAEGLQQNLRSRAEARTNEKRSRLQELSPFAVRESP
ncbi:unnamed protein product [Closterium sp. NIES-65]|nr:unnamed protein product [Closterium sp. NIES-65]